MDIIEKMIKEWIYNECAPGDLKYIIDNEIQKLKYDIAFQKSLEKNSYFLEEEIIKLQKIKIK